MALLTLSEVSQPLRVYRETTPAPRQLPPAGKSAGSQLAAAARYRRELQLRMPPLLDGWDVTGAIVGSDSDTLHGGLYDWSMCEDGSLAVATGCAAGQGMTAAFAATFLIGALRCHAGYQLSASDLMRQLNGNLWMGSTGDHFASLVYARVCPGDSQIALSHAGRIHCLLAGPDGAAWLEADQAEPLGTEPERSFQQRFIQVTQKSLLILAAVPETVGSTVWQQSLGDIVQRRQHELPSPLANCLVTDLENSTSTDLTGFSLLVFRRL